MIAPPTMTLKPSGRTAFLQGPQREETAEALKVSPKTVLNDWSLAKAWLLRELSNRESHETDANGT